MYLQEQIVKVSSRTQVLKRGPGRPPKDRSAENSLFAEVIVKILDLVLLLDIIQ